MFSCDKSISNFPFKLSVVFASEFVDITERMFPENTRFEMFAIYYNALFRFYITRNITERFWGNLSKFHLFCLFWWTSSVGVFVNDGKCILRYTLAANKLLLFCQFAFHLSTLSNNNFRNNTFKIDCIM